MDRFDHLSWPTPQEEEWRRTDVTQIDFDAYDVLQSEGESSTIAATPAALAAEGSGVPPEPRLESGFAARVCFEGGSCRQLALRPELRSKGVRFGTLSALSGGEDIGAQALQAVRRALEEGFRGLDNRLQAWHYSSLSHGVFLYVPPFVEIGELLVVELAEAGRNVVSAPHVAMILDRGARAKVLIRTVGDGAADLPSEGARRWPLLVNLGLDLEVGESAALELYHLQDLPLSALTFSHASARVGRDGRLVSFEAALGSGLLKSRLECSLDGPGAEALLHGVYLSRERQHLDIRTVQRHRAAHTSSRGFYKGAIKDRSRSIFQGLIEVAPAAAKTDAFLTDRNLILNDGARADSIPSLRIDTNDVKCSHGSTTGRLDETQVFYLMTRGLSRSEAERMLILGYFEELLGQTPERFADELRGLIGRRVESEIEGASDDRG